MALWHWYTSEHHVTISLVNDRYRHIIWLRWYGQYGKLIDGPVVSFGYSDTLARAKQTALRELEEIWHRC